MLVTVPLKLGADRIFGGDVFPRIGLELLHAEADALRLGIDADDLHLHRVADIHDLARMGDASPGHVGDMQQAVDAAEIDEGAIVGDVLDHAVDDLALFEPGDDLAALLGAGLFQHRAAGDDDIAAAAIHLQDLEGLRHVHQRADVAHRADVDLAARQESHGAVEIDGEAALDAVEDHALDALARLVFLLEPGPAFLAARLLAATARPRRPRSRPARDRHRPRRRRKGRAARPEMPNSFRGMRPSVLRPTSITATSFSMPTMVPLTTLPSWSAVPVRDSSSRAANSSRLGWLMLVCGSFI